MTTVGVRELRGGLSGYLDEVRHGHSLTITDRGVPLARLVAAEDETVVDQLAKQGRVTLPSSAKQPAPSPVQAQGTVSDLVADQRR